MEPATLTPKDLKPGHRFKWNDHQTKYRTVMQVIPVPDDGPPRFRGCVIVCFDGCKQVTLEGDHQVTVETT